ncbi:MAG TPA: GGDEF domain-containing protein [Noviherbaspirillum sp.]
MSAVLNSNAAWLQAPRNGTSTEPSFAGWLQGLSSGLDIAADVNQILDDILRDAPAANVPALWPYIDVVMTRQKVRAAENRIRELETQLAHMRELAHEDQLTGSLNRRGLDDVLERELARAERRQSPLCVAMLDLDNFKKLNDMHGHCAGDAALVHLVQVVKAVLRKMDVIARFGGEEFIIVLPDTPLAGGMQTLMRVQAELRACAFLHDHTHVPLTFSAGVALYKAGEEQEALIERADRALYKAKQDGKNRVVSSAE